MKKSQLRYIIREEIHKTISEHDLEDSEVRIPFGLSGTHSFRIANIGTGKVKVGKDGIIADNNIFVSWQEIRDLMKNYEG
jgi:hypothetical protein